MIHNKRNCPVTRQLVSRTDQLKEKEKTYRRWPRKTRTSVGNWLPIGWCDEIVHIRQRCQETGEGAYDADGKMAKDLAR